MATKKITKEEALLDLQTRNHHISVETAESRVKKYKAFRTKLASAKKSGEGIKGSIPDLPLFLTYNKKAIQGLLKKPGCVGIRMYPAINDESMVTLVLVAVDENGVDITEDAPASPIKATKGVAMIAKAAPGGTRVDEGQTCPPYPAP